MLLLIFCEEIKNWTDTEIDIKIQSSLISKKDPDSNYINNTLLLIRIMYIVGKEGNAHQLKSENYYTSVKNTSKFQALRKNKNPEYIQDILQDWLSGQQWRRSLGTLS